MDVTRNKPLALGAAVTDMKKDASQTSIFSNIDKEKMSRPNSSESLNPNPKPNLRQNRG